MFSTATNIHEVKKGHCKNSRKICECWIILISTKLVFKLIPSLIALLHFCAANVFEMYLGPTMKVCFFQILKLKKEPQMEKILLNMMEDLVLFEKAVITMSYILVGPLAAAVVTYVLWNFLGASSLAGMALLVLLIPLQCK